jgi:Skp family chaperone for outer membrane proteins
MSFDARLINKFALPFVFASLLFSGAAFAENFAYVDLQRAVFEVNDGKAAKARLEEMKKQR